MTLLSSDSFNRAQPVVNPLASDSFVRADSTTSLDSTDGSGALDPLAWTAQDGTWGITGNRAYSTVLGSGGFGSIATVDLGTGDVDVTITKVGIDATAAMGIILRFSDLNNFFAIRGGASPTTITVWKRAAGVNTSLFSGSSLNVGDILRVIAHGSTISVYRNGALVTTVTDSFNQTATKHGLNASTVAVNQNYFGSSFVAVTNPALPLGSDGGTLGSTDGVGALDPLPWYQWALGYGWGITGNQAYTPAQSWNPNPCIATVDATTADADMRVTVVARSNQVGVVWRFADRNNYWYWFSWSTSPQVFVGKFVAGVFTRVAYFPFTAWGNGDAIRVLCSGSTMTGYQNGAQVWTITDTDLQTNTHFGMLTQQEFPGSLPGGDPGGRFDDFQLGLSSGWYVDQIAMAG